MDRDKIAKIYFGAMIAGFVYLNVKYNKRTTFLLNGLVQTHNTVDAMLQADVDRVFAEIVENYDE